MGFALNAINTIKFAKGRYAWLIGNDDLILPNTLNYLKNLFENNKQVEYFFINSYYLDSNLLKKYNQPFDTNTLQELNLKKLSKLKESKKVKFLGSHRSKSFSGNF